MAIALHKAIETGNSWIEWDISILTVIDTSRPLCLSFVRQVQDSTLLGKPKNDFNAESCVTICTDATPSSVPLNEDFWRDSAYLITNLAAQEQKWIR